MSFIGMHFGAGFVAALAIVAGAFVSEDAATITAASLAAASVLVNDITGIISRRWFAA